MESKSNEVIRKVIIVAIMIIFGGSCLLFFLNPSPNVKPLIVQHYKVLIGMPSACITSLFLILLLKQSETPIKFKGLSFEFEGASGEVILWVICLLSIVHSIDLLWKP